MKVKKRTVKAKRESEREPANRLVSLSKEDTSQIILSRIRKKKVKESKNSKVKVKESLPTD